MTSKSYSIFYLFQIFFLVALLNNFNLSAAENCQGKNKVSVESNLNICIPQARYQGPNGQIDLLVELQYWANDNGVLVWKLAQVSGLNNTPINTTTLDTLSECEGHAEVSIADNLDICIPLLTYASSGSETQELWATLKFIGSTDSGDYRWKLSGAAEINKKLMAIKEQCLIPEEQILSAIDLSSPMIKALYDTYKSVDPYHAFPLFLQVSADFIHWIDEFSASLTTALHESNHFMDSVLGSNSSTSPSYPDGISLNCSHVDGKKYYLMGEVYQTALESSHTSNYSIVEETIEPKLKAASRYTTYIEGAKDFDNDFRILLDELNAYTGDGWFQVHFHRSGLPYEGNFYSNHQFQIDGIVNFMVYLQNYLKSARLNYPDVYQTIASQKETLGYINFLWSLAEKVVEDSYDIIANDRSAKFIFYDVGGEASGLAHMQAAYSDDLLAELDRLSISHKDKSYWNNSYFAQ